MDPEPITPRGPRLAFGSFFWRAVALTFALVVLVAMRKVAGRLLFRKRPLVAFLMVAPQCLVFAVVFGGVLTFLVGMFVVLIVRPLVWRWHNPAVTVDGSTPHEFRLSARERILGRVPARRLEGRRWRPGALALTDQRLWFFPAAWDAEPWSVPRDAIRALCRVPAPRPLGGLIEGLPDRVEVRAGEVVLFATGKPGEILAWFEPEMAGVVMERA